MISRTTSAAFINSVVNAPEVYPLVSFDGVGELDLSGAVADPDNVCLTTDRGGFLFAKQEAGVYQLHTFFLPSGRGRHALVASHKAADFMFTQTDCVEILTMSPDDNVLSKPPVHMGFVQDFRRDAVMTRNGVSVGASFWALRYPEWVKRAEWLCDGGRLFHDRLDARMKRANPHDDDAEHDKRVGAFCAMIEGGQVQKACLLYNRWAMFAGYMPVLIESLDPIVLDIGDARLRVKEDRKDFEVMPCQ